MLDDDLATIYGEKELTAGWVYGTQSGRGFFAQTAETVPDGVGGFVEVRRTELRVRASEISGLRNDTTITIDSVGYSVRRWAPDADGRVLVLQLGAA